MKIFAIIVTYNGMKWYKNCFNSIQNSSIPIRTIVIDNCSTDNTVNYVKVNYPEIHLIESKKNLGFGKANNIGFKYALENNADFVFLLNQDAWLMPDTIEKLCQQMEQNHEYGILSPIHLNGTEKGLDYNFSKYINTKDCPDLISDYIAKGKPEAKIYQTKFVNAALWLISRDCLEKIGGFCPLFPHYGEDDNYVQRLYYHQMKLGIYPFAKGVHDRPQNNSCNKNKNTVLISFLNVLCNINYSYIHCFLLSLRELFHILFVSKEIVNLVKSSYIIMYNIPKIIKHRNMDKKIKNKLLYIE